MKSRGKGFTLIEALVALIIFGILTAALGVALSTSLRAEVALEGSRGEEATARAVFHFLEQDIQAAYPAPNSPTSLFVASGAPSTVQLPPSLLYFSAYVGRIQTQDPNIDPALALNSNVQQNLSSSVNGNSWLPQWDCALIRYWLDANTGELHRTVVNVPNLQLFTQTNTANPEQDVIASKVVSMQLHFWDPNQQTWRDSWDFEQPNWQQQVQQLMQQSSSGQQNGSNNTTASSTTTGDMQLPSAVQVILTLQGTGGRTDTFTTTIPVDVQQPPTPNMPLNSANGANNQNSNLGVGSATGGGMP